MIPKIFLKQKKHFKYSILVICSTTIKQDNHGDIFHDRAIYGHFPLIVCLQITTFVEVSLQLKQYQNCQQKIFVADLQNEFFSSTETENEYV